ncbi:MAG: tetraacyldisaccharide 4-kinase, partial [Bacteroidota bacterium]|nr:tetraacyldisaccharide 4-kinase [Bacteroidota bacterium]
MLQYLYKVSTLSRGYGRTSHGFLVADEQSTALQIGDEPRQFKAKFPETIVSVCEDRVFAIPKILFDYPEADLILLDDAFQHRAVRPGLSILVTEYNNLFASDYVLPVGWLREARSNYHRADIIIVSKCPANLSEEERQRVISIVNPFRYQKIYFSAMQYGQLYSFIDTRVKMQLTKEIDVLLVCGIARFEELKNYLQEKAANVYVRDYRDHHRFDRYDLEAIR